MFSEQGPPRSQACLCVCVRLCPCPSLSAHQGMQLVCKFNSSPQKSSPSLPNKIDRSFSLTSLFLLDIRGRTACVALIIIDTRLSQASPHSLCDILIVIAYTCLCACFFSTFMSPILQIIPDLNGICILLAVDTLTAPYGWFFFRFFSFHEHRSLQQARSCC